MNKLLSPSHPKMMSTLTAFSLSTGSLVGWDLIFYDSEDGNTVLQESFFIVVVIAYLSEGLVDREKYIILGVGKMDQQGFCKIISHSLFCFPCLMERRYFRYCWPVWNFVFFPSKYNGFGNVFLSQLVSIEIFLLWLLSNTMMWDFMKCFLQMWEMLGYEQSGDLWRKRLSKGTKNAQPITTLLIVWSSCFHHLTITIKV